MNPLGRAALGRDLPGPVRKLLLARLFADTAVAFGRPVPPLPGLSADQVLVAFRDFTAEVGLETATCTAVSDRLYAMANRYGKLLRRLFGVASMDDAMATARFVYRTIGIDFHGQPDGEITISRCFFSVAYTPEVCQVISALDAGLLAGLSEGRTLAFTQRITEGYACCRARLGSVEATP